MFLTQTLRVGKYSLFVKGENPIPEIDSAATKTTGKRRIATIAVAIFGSGVALPILGFTLAIVHSMIERDQIFGVVGTVCLIVTIPMILLGSHLMDKFDQAK